MSFNNQNNNESIFNDTTGMSLPEKYSEITEPQSSGLLDLFDKFVNKFIDEPKQKLEIKKFQKQGNAILKEHEEILKIFYDFGCNLVLNDKYIDIEYMPLELVGRITITDDGKAEFDENTQKIMEQLAKLIANANGLGGMMQNYEEQKFYPTGELTKTTISINGNPVEVMTGTLMNPQGETKQIYYHKGKEVYPD